MNDTILHHGGCYCGRARYQVKAPAALTVYECNCEQNIDDYRAKTDNQSEH